VSFIQFSKLIEANGFEVFNDMDKPEHATCESGGKPDLILERNANPNREIIDRGVPPNADDTLSDHLPYYVKVRYK